MPGPYRQMSLSAVTIAFRLSTVGMGVDVSVGIGVAVGGMGLGVNVSVGGRGVAVKVAGRTGSSVFVAGSGAGVEAGAHALRRKIKLIKIANLPLKLLCSLMDIFKTDMSWKIWS